ncbi:hypothetical protein [Streptomyces sp. H27-H5]|uniref:hypothetical protein n=1 Tax=Streptomyces sp. H27-H5 TaxID=2996460 RepID=UPI00227154CE|nr:hypothetical protein [Streptomyces sp. H27-H5]MCY0955824.1 hypothetical protein [Streptomyces sp. H27-H5]
MDYTHLAIGTIAPYFLARIEWTAGKRDIQFVLKEHESLKDVAVYRAELPAVLPSATPSDSFLDALTTRVLTLIPLEETEWDRDAIRCATYLSQHGGWRWGDWRSAS